MPIQVNIQNGSISPAGSTLTNGCSFQWANPTSSPVKVKNCGGFCTQSEYDIQPNSTANASILANPPGPFTFTEQPNEWNAPGQPHIVVNPMPAAADADSYNKEVA